MPIKGFQGTSLLDFPGRVASLIFFSGCNLRCPYCHNPSLVQNSHQYPDIAITEILAMLKQRCGFIDGVVISGGEPTLSPQLVEIVQQIKQLGLQVKLDTNGLRPDVLKTLMAQDLLDFVGMDIKTSLSNYSKLHDGDVDIAALQRSVTLLMDATIEVEFRTTCVPGIVTEDDIHQMGKLLQGAKLWVLQQFVAEPAMTEDLRRCEPYSITTLEQFADISSGYVQSVMVRGV